MYRNIESTKAKEGLTNCMTSAYAGIHNIILYYNINNNLIQRV